MRLTSAFAFCALWLLVSCAPGLAASCAPPACSVEPFPVSFEQEERPGARPTANAAAQSSGLWTLLFIGRSSSSNVSGARDDYPTGEKPRLVVRLRERT